MAKSVLRSKTIMTVLTIAVLLVMAGIGFMASVQTELWASAVAIAGLLTLIAIIDAFRSL